MIDRAMIHETLTFERWLEASSTEVFDAYVDVERRTRWSTPSDSAVFVYLENDFRVGGIDRFRCGDQHAPQYSGSVRYEDIVPGERIIYSETIEAGGERLSVALVSWEFRSEGSGTRLRVTVQIASLVGADMIAGNKTGMDAALENLVALLAR